MAACFARLSVIEIFLDANYLHKTCRNPVIDALNSETLGLKISQKFPTHNYNFVFMCVELVNVIFPMWLQCTRTTKIHNRCSSLLVLLKIRVTSTTGAAQLIECDFYAYFSMKNGSVISSKSPSEGQRALSCWNSTYAPQKKGNARRSRVCSIWTRFCIPSSLYPASLSHL